MKIYVPKSFNLKILSETKPRNTNKLKSFIFDTYEQVWCSGN